MIRVLLFLIPFALLTACQNSNPQGQASSYPTQDPGPPAQTQGPPRGPRLPKPPRPPKFSQMPHKDAAYIGMGIYEAESLARSRGLIHRVATLDGQSQPGSRDLRPNRVNFDVENGIVVHAVRG